MATNFPASLDTLTNPTSSDSLSSPSHSAQHANVNDAIEALQAKVGVDSSAVASSLDYKVAQLEAISHGKILQVVSTSVSGAAFTTTSTAYVAVTGLNVTITPSSATSKILLMLNASGDPGTTGYLIGTIFRGTVASGTDLGSGTDGFGALRSPTAGMRGMFAIHHLDSPATTSATTYNFAVKINSATLSYVMNGGAVGSFTAMEVSA